MDKTATAHLRLSAFGPQLRPPLARLQRRVTPPLPSCAASVSHLLSVSRHLADRNLQLLRLPLVCLRRPLQECFSRRHARATEVLHGPLRCASSMPS